VQGTAENIPLPDDSIDGAIATLTLHHWPSIENGFKELARVLKPGSSLEIFTFTPEQERGYWFNHFFPEMMKRGRQKSVSLETITEAAHHSGLELAGTEKYFVGDDLQDMFGYSGKNDPERYFDPAIIKGISYFSIYADKAEVEDGLRELRISIDNGSFSAIKQQYENDLGDYLFVVLKKK
jgi:SAM-dependent methyltransferase